MNLKQIVFSLLLISSSFTLWAQSEKFQFHKVQAGETVFSLCKKYNISEADFYKFNPNARNGIRIGELLMVPMQKENEEESLDTTKFLKHVVREGETLYSITRKYGVGEDEIKNLNPYLNERPLQLGSTLIIPKFPRRNPVIQEEQRIIKEESKPIEESVPEGFHKVKEGETLFSIARQYETKVADLIELNKNAGIEQGIRVGQVIQVHDKKKSLTSPIESLASDSGDERSTQFKTYRIQEGDTEEDILERFNLSKKDLYKFNPEIKSLGFKKGVLLVIPQRFAVQTGGVSDKKTERAYSGVSIRVVLLLPIDPALLYDSDVKKGLGNIEQAGFEFYTGFKIALDSLEQMGYHIKANIDYLNPKENDMKSWADKSEIRESNIIFGPFFTKQAEQLADLLAKEPIKIISPLSKNINLANRPGLYNSYPDDEAEFQAISRLIVDKFNNHSILIVSTGKEPQAFRTEKLSQLLEDKKIPFRKVNTDRQTIAKYEFTQIQQDQKTLVVCLSDDRLIITDMVAKLALLRNDKIILLGRSNVLEIPTVEQRYLNRLRFTTVESSYSDFKRNDIIELRRKFHNQFEIEPTKYAYHGFDITYYFVNRFADNQAQAVQLSQTGFNFKPIPGGGYRNTHLKALQVENFSLKVLE